MKFSRRTSAVSEVEPPERAVDDPTPFASDTGADGAVRRNTEGKGRPTPKRRDAEGRRRGPAPPPPKTQRESMKLAKANKTRRKDERRKRGGPDRELQAKDRGPVKAFARDFVDSRRHVIGLFLPLALLVFVSLLMRDPRMQSAMSLFSLSMMVVIALDGVLLGRRVTKAARERFPNEEVSAPALSWYSFTRASQIRRLRVPKPSVKVGATV